MKFIFAILLIPLLIIPTAFAESQVSSTDKGSLDVKLTYDPIEPNIQSKINIDFLKPNTEEIQVHVDYSISISKDGETVFTTDRLIHTSEGSVKIPIEFNLGDGIYIMNVGVEGIQFFIIPPETASFDIIVGEAHAQPSVPSNNGENGGGCLIATAAFGSELAPQVQQLRELRDNTILETSSGAAFMTGFNQFYYSFSPAIADLEREQPVFKEIMKIVLTPMLSSLSLLNYVDIDSDQEMLGYGISMILLNVGMYAGIPIFGILKIHQARKN